MKSLTGIERLQAEHWLEVAKNSVLPIDARFARARSWPDNADTFLNGKVKKLIGAKGCPAPVQPLDQALIDPDAFPDARGGHIPRTAFAYAEAARPLLQTSSKVVLVDPYFSLRFFHAQTSQMRPSTRHWKSLSVLVTVALKWKRVEIFKLMVSADTALIGDPEGETFSSDLEELMNDTGAAGNIAIEWDCLDRTVSTERHPRYLLGMASGLHFDWGFDTDLENTTNHV